LLIVGDVPMVKAHSGKYWRKTVSLRFLTEGAMVADQVNIERRRAIERTAHFFMELAERLSVIGFATETEFKCPLSQFVLADALGLSAIQVNRSLRQLREKDLLTL
jgi:CRP-like cAMP-binding protein